MTAIPKPKRTADTLIRMVEQSMGLNGFVVVTPASGVTTGAFYAIKAINADAVIDAGTVSVTGDNLPEDTVISRGDVVSGNFSAVKIKNGSVLAYLI